jgi:hypothetical protein
VAEDFGVELVNLDTLCARSDFITLHAVVNQENRRMINAESIARMKTGVRIINAARGVNRRSALAQAIKNGRSPGPGRVYSEEPPPPITHDRTAQRDRHAAPAASTVERRWPSRWSGAIGGRGAAAGGAKTSSTRSALSWAARSEWGSRRSAISFQPKKTKQRRERIVGTWRVVTLLVVSGDLERLSGDREHRQAPERNGVTFVEDFRADILLATSAGTGAVRAWPGR